MVAPNPNSDTPPTIEERLSALEARMPVIAALFTNANSMLEMVHKHSQLVDGKVDVVKRMLDAHIDHTNTTNKKDATS
jgi:ABC-type transporter Mla subunit MlaD